jgi:hypothetical protein
LKNEPDPLVPDSFRDMSAREKAMLNLVIRAVAEGDLKAIKDIDATPECRPAQSLSLAGDPENPVAVDQAAEKFLSLHESGWRNAKHRQQWRNTLKDYAYPTLGARPVKGDRRGIDQSGLSANLVHNPGRRSETHPGVAGRFAKA